MNESRDLVELSCKLISIDSTTGQGTSSVARWLAELARSWGLRAEILEDTWNGVSQANIVVTHAELSAGGADLLLSSRLDTADPGEYATWTKTGANPFNASVNGDELFGLGACDGKLDFLCKLIAFKAACESMAPAAALLGTFGRESGTGAIRLIRQKKIKPRMALVGSPTGLRLATRAPGYAKVEIALPLTVREREYIEEQSISEGTYSQSKVFSNAANKARVDFGLPDNPIFRMIDYMKKLPSGIAVLSIDGGTSADTYPTFVELEVQIVDQLQETVITKLIAVGDRIKHLAIELKTVEADDFSPPFSTLNVGQIRMLNEEVKLSGVCRLVPAADREIYERWLEKLRLDCAAAGAQFHIVDYKPPIFERIEEPFITRLKGVSSALGLSMQGIAAHQCTEANVFNRLGVKTAIFGPGNGLAHEPASLEHVRISELKTAIAFYKNVLQAREV